MQSTHTCKKPKEPLYRPKYPEAFFPMPHHGPCFTSTIYNTCPTELVYEDWMVPSNHWNTSTGTAHGPKVPYRTTPLIIRKAPSSQRITYIFPNIENDMKGTSQGLLYNPSPFYNTVMKTDYQPKRAIADFDYQNGPLVYIPGPRYIRSTKKTFHRPTFDQDELFSIARKYHPYLSQTKFDYRDPTKDKNKYDSCRAY